MRYAILASAVIMQMCLGATYSWSVFVQPIKELTGLQQGGVQVPFSTFYFIFPLTVMVAGSLLNRIGPRACAMTGGLLFGGGWLLASLGDQSFIYTILGIGLLAGAGAGMAYLVPIAVSIRWFPENKGFVTGIAVAGFGGGAAVVSQLGGWLMHTHHWTPFATFASLGIGFLFCITGAGSLMNFPPQTHVQTPQSTISRKSLLTDRGFLLLYLAMFTGLAAGFAINANLKQLCPLGSISLGVTGVSLFALANGAGRISWGIFFDKISSATAVKANLMSQTFILLLSPWILQSSTGFLIFATLAGFNYGGVLVIYVSTATRRWGADQVGNIYGLLFSSNIPAALSPVGAGLLFDRTGSFTPALLGLALCLGVASIVIFLTTSTINSHSKQLS